MTIRIDTDLLIPGRGEPIKDGTVIMEDDTISFAGERSDAPSGAPDRTIEVPVLLPGLWDCHIHFGTQTPDELGSAMMPSPALLGSRAVTSLAGRSMVV
jgi:imidazolonepropionase-like amidohydrolase